MGEFPSNFYDEFYKDIIDTLGENFFEFKIQKEIFLELDELIKKKEQSSWGNIFKNIDAIFRFSKTGDCFLFTIRSKKQRDLVTYTFPLFYDSIDEFRIFIYTDEVNYSIFRIRTDINVLEKTPNML